MSTAPLRIVAKYMIEKLCTWMGIPDKYVKVMQTLMERWGT